MNSFKPIYNSFATSDFNSKKNFFLLFEATIGSKVITHFGSTGSCHKMYLVK